MPLRLRNVRVSIQRNTNTKNARGFLSTERSHVAFIRGDLYPLSAEQTARFSTAGYDATWRLVAYQPKPEVKDGDFIVTFSRDKSEELVLKVTKKVQRGLRQDVALTESGAEQPPDAATDTPASPES